LLITGLLHLRTVPIPLFSVSWHVDPGTEDKPVALGTHGLRRTPLSLPPMLRDSAWKNNSSRTDGVLGHEFQMPSVFSPHPERLNRGLFFALL